MKKQATLFDMVKKMKNTPLAIALELSKSTITPDYSQLTHADIYSQSPSTQKLAIQSDYEASQIISNTSGKRFLEAIIESDLPPAKETKCLKTDDEEKQEKSSTQESCDLIDQEFETIVKKVKLETTMETEPIEQIDPKLLGPVETEQIKIALKEEVKIEEFTQKKSLNDVGYNPYVDAPFNESEDVPFYFIIDCFEMVSQTHGENSKEKIIDMFCNLFRTILLLRPDQLALAYYFCVLRICPDYQKDKELGVGSATLIKAISKATGRAEKSIREGVNVTGDLGIVASMSKNSQTSLQKFFTKKEEKKCLTVKTVMETFKRLSKLKGTNSNVEKERSMTKLILDAREDEAKYIVRFVEGLFHLGAAESTMQCGLVRAFIVRNHIDERVMKTKTKGWASYIPDFEAKFKKYEEMIDQAINEHPDYDKLIEGLIKAGSDIESIRKFCKITTGVPVNPMLANPASGLEVIMKRFQNRKFTCEYKYDGLRGQIHYRDGEYKIYSRKQIEMTEAYPDVIEVFKEVVSSKVKSFIIDSEIVAFNPETQKILPFQRLTTRGRKNVDQNQIEIQVCVFAFDLLYYEEESLLQLSLRERRNILYKNFPELDNRFRYAVHRNVEIMEEVRDFLAESIKMGAEGLMVKNLDNNSIYEPGIRSFSWMKLKKDYLEDGSADTYDLVPIGAYYGLGRKAGLFGGYLLACYNNDLERYETFCVCSAGITDENLIKFTNFFKENTIRERPSNYHTGNVGADFWVKPCVVWEVKGADIQISPIYTAGVQEMQNGKGLGLRFPRIVNIRDDKNPTDATDSVQIAEIYSNQAAVLNDE